MSFQVYFEVPLSTSLSNRPNSRGCVVKQNSDKGTYLIRVMVWIGGGDCADRLNIKGRDSIFSGST